MKKIFNLVSGLFALIAALYKPDIMPFLHVICGFISGMNISYYILSNTLYEEDV